MKTVFFLHRTGCLVVEAVKCCSLQLSKPLLLNTFICVIHLSLLMSQVRGAKLDCALP